MDDDHLSDHILATRLMDKFLQAKREDRAWAFCKQNSLVYMLRDLKTQYGQYLCDLGFITTPSYTDHEYNQNSNNVKLLKSVLAAGLCPNIAVCK